MSASRTHANAPLQGTYTVHTRAGWRHLAGIQVAAVDCATLNVFLAIILLRCRLGPSLHAKDSTATLASQGLPATRVHRRLLAGLRRGSGAPMPSLHKMLSLHKMALRWALIEASGGGAGMTESAGPRDRLSERGKARQTSDDTDWSRLGKAGGDLSTALDML